MEKILSNRKLLANQCLVFAFILYIVSTSFINMYPFLAFFKAFSEAAIVGGIADWFAVTALFKHPLGLKIPHTAIIPNSKSKIGKNLSQFIRENFLSEKYVKDNLNKIDIHEKASILLKENEKAISNRLIDLAFNQIKSLEYKDVNNFIYPLIKKKIDDLDINLIIINLFEMIDNRNYHHAAFKEFLIQLNKWLSVPENEHMINEEIKDLIRKDSDGKNTFTGVLKSMFIGEPKLHKYLTDFINHMENDPEQKVIKRVDNFFDDLIVKLKEEPKVRNMLVELKANIIANSDIEYHVEKIFYDIKKWVMDDFHHIDSFIKSRINIAVNSTINEIATNKVIKRWIKRQVEGKVPAFIAENAGLIDNYFIEYIENLDTDQVSKLIEEKVGEDLQYIRINGTVIGGLIGVILYTLTEIIKYSVSYFY